MKFFKRNPGFDELFQQLPPNEQSRLLPRYHKLDVARAWLEESGVSYTVQDIVLLAKGLEV